MTEITKKEYVKQEMSSENRDILDILAEKYENNGIIISLTREEYKKYVYFMMSIPTFHMVRYKKLIRLFVRTKKE